MRKNLALLSSSLVCSSIALSAGTWEEGRFTVFADFVYLEQSQPISDPLATDTYNDVNHQVLTTKDLSRGFKYGVQGGAAYRVDKKNMYSTMGMYLWPLDNTQVKTPKGVLSFPFTDPTFASSYTGVDSLKEQFRRELYTVEIDYQRTFSDTRHGYLTLTGLFGIRFAEVSEKLYITSYKGGVYSNYNIDAKNGLMGLQAGLDFQIHPTRRFYWNLVLKGGIDLNRIDSRVYLGNAGNTEVLRNYKKNNAQAGAFAEGTVGAGCQILRNLNLHVGYHALYFGGIAQARKQIDYSSNQTASTKILSSYDVRDDGYILLHGVVAGLGWDF